MKKILTDSFEVVEYELKSNDLNINEIYYSMKEMNLTIYSKLDKKERIHYQLRDSKSNIIFEINNKDYRTFIETFKLKK